MQKLGISIVCTWKQRERGRNKKSERQTEKEREKKIDR